jgi:hypothetical protein
MSPSRLRGWRRARAAWLKNRARPPPAKKKRRPGHAETALPKSDQPPSRKDYRHVK